MRRCASTFEDFAIIRALRNKCLFIALGIGLGVRLLLIFTDRVRLIGDLFFDDAFYLLNIARNIAAGSGISHDGLLSKGVKSAPLAGNQPPRSQPFLFKQGNSPPLY